MTCLFIRDGACPRLFTFYIIEISISRWLSQRRFSNALGSPSGFPHYPLIKKRSRAPLTLILTHTSHEIGSLLRAGRRVFLSWIASASISTYIFIKLNTAALKYGIQDASLESHIRRTHFACILLAHQFSITHNDLQIRSLLRLTE